MKRTYPTPEPFSIEFDLIDDRGDTVKKQFAQYQLSYFYCFCEQILTFCTKYKPGVNTTCQPVKCPKCQSVYKHIRINEQDFAQYIVGSHVDDPHTEQHQLSLFNK